MKDFFINLINVTPWWEVLFIFVGVIIEGGFTTLRLITITKGYRKLAVLSTFIGVTISVFLMSMVIVGISENILKGIAYSLGYSIGIYTGSKLEDLLAYGKVNIRVITTKEMGNILIVKLSDDGFDITKLAGKGKDGLKEILIMNVKRKKHSLLVDKIKSIDVNAVVTSNNLSSIKGSCIFPIKRYIK